MRKHYFVSNKNATLTFVWRTALWFNASASCRIHLCSVSQEWLSVTEMFTNVTSLVLLQKHYPHNNDLQLPSPNNPKIVHSNVTKHQLFSFPTSLFKWNTACMQCRFIARSISKKTDDNASEMWGKTSANNSGEEAQTWNNYAGGRHPEPGSFPQQWMTARPSITEATLTTESNDSVFDEAIRE